ncbi:MAG: DNA alkylation repair protein [Sedimentibacter sp.]|jgi:3-methyladenine DNA glycosylase AlkD
MQEDITILKDILIDYFIGYLKGSDDLNNIIEVFYKNRNEELAVPMAKYMKNMFPFLGIKTPERKTLSKEFLNSRKNDTEVDWEFIDKCFLLPEREFHYLGISYMNTVKNLFTINDMERIKGIITYKSWWDSVDSISPIVGYICIKYPHIKDDVIDKWIFSDNIWLKRVSILFQLKYKENTDTEFLTKAIVNNSDTSEFFINKAIGWALREYSKTDKVWVRDFINRNELSKLSIREGSKYL